MRKILFLCFAAMFMTSCSPFVLKSSGALNGSDLASYESFQVQEIDKETLPEGIIEADLIRLYDALAKEMEMRGYTRVKSGADLTIYLGLSTKESLETDVNTTGFSGGYAGYVGPRRGWGPYNYFGATPYIHSYYGNSTATTELVTDGVLMVDLVDNSDNNHVFCSQLSANIDGKTLILRNNEMLAKAAAKAFQKFPVEKVK